MRVKVELYVAGQVFTEEVRAVDYLSLIHI